ncbi:hypothetical protein C8D89_1062 [Actinomycetospora cinnamomea]|uniref:NUDIX domain-containing protein n=1 Tax=Actinomycetospora cinnamomea TaxID=663609 RepID=A0A2U1FAX9_9PSEU|nr:hypothetical protein C8D89_1062 [Actinomycetospora cinnamomea]
MRGVVALVFRCRLLDGTPGPTEESADAGWFDLHETERLLVPAVAIRLLDAARPAGTPPASRVHDGTDVR